LTLTKIQDIAKRLITAGGTEVYIISARDNAASMYALANKLGIPMYRVFAEGSNEGKIEKIKELNIRTHYDNNPDVIREIPSIGKLI
jgi:soluble P-type ATPase